MNSCIVVIYKRLTAYIQSDLGRKRCVGVGSGMLRNIWVGS